MASKFAKSKSVFFPKDDLEQLKMAEEYFSCHRAKFVNANQTENRMAYDWGVAFVKETAEEFFELFPQYKRLFDLKRIVWTNKTIDDNCSKIIDYSKNGQFALTECYWQKKSEKRMFSIFLNGEHCGEEQRVVMREKIIHEFAHAIMHSLNISEDKVHDNAHGKRFLELLNVIAIKYRQEEAPIEFKDCGPNYSKKRSKAKGKRLLPMKHVCVVNGSESDEVEIRKSIEENNPRLKSLKRKRNAKESNVLKRICI